MVHYQRDGRSPIPESEVTSRVMSANRGKDTGPEMRLRKALWARGARGYRVHPKDLPGRPDIVYPRLKLAIMVNGCFWHRCPKCNPSLPKVNELFWEVKFQRNIERDARKVKELNDLGWSVLVIWECSIQSNLEGVLERVMQSLVVN